VSTSAVDTWRAFKIRTENLTEVPNGFLPLIQVPPMIPNKTEVLNLKTRKTQVPMGYLSLNYNINLIVNASQPSFLLEGVFDEFIYLRG
jgi:hypothetical protein